MLGCMSAAWNQAETRCLREDGHQGKCSARPPCLLWFHQTLDGPCFEKLLPVSDSRPKGIQGTGLDAYTRAQEHDSGSYEITGR